MIEIAELTKVYEADMKALDRLDLAVDEGEIYCLLGANGAGKTTALNILLNFVEPTSGYARICGVDVTREPIRARRSVAYLSENVRLYENFTAQENAEFFVGLGRDRRIGRDEIERACDAVGLDPGVMRKRVRTYSKGMRQKLGLAICVLIDAPVLLLDEPLSGLDPEAAHQLVATLRELRRSGKTILMSTHDIFRARELADRIGIMRQGKKVLERSAEGLFAEGLESIYLQCMREGFDAAA